MRVTIGPLWLANAPTPRGVLVPAAEVDPVRILPVACPRPGAGKFDVRSDVDVDGLIGVLSIGQILSECVVCAETGAVLLLKTGSMDGEWDGKTDELDHLLCNLLALCQGPKTNKRKTRASNAVSVPPSFS